MGSRNGEEDEMEERRENMEMRNASLRFSPGLRLGVRFFPENIASTITVID